MKGNDVIAAIMKAEGVEALTCFPHSEFIDAAAAVGIRPILARTERAAIGIADGFARMTDGRRPIASTVQYGPGSENAFGAIAQAYADNVPLLYLPTGYSLPEQGTIPNFSAALNLRHVLKWGEQAVLPERLAQMTHHAFAQLRNGRLGPVMLEVPYDLTAADCDFDPESYPVTRPSLPRPDEGQLEEVLDKVLAAENPMIIAGQGCLYGQAWDELLAFAEFMGLPVMTTLNGKSAFPENHPLSLGTGGASRPDTVKYFLSHSDLVLGLGTSFTRSDYITPVPDGKTMVQITNSETDIGKDYPIALGVLGDVKAALASLLSQAKARLGEDGQRNAAKVTESIAALREAYLGKWMPLLTANEVPINPFRVVWELMHSVDRRKTVVTHDAGSPRDQMTAFYESIVPHGYMGWGKTTQLGLGLPLMIGAKLARPDWLCVNVMGDAAIGMIGMEIETAARANLPILTIVLKNSVMGGYGGEEGYLPIASAQHNIHELGGDYCALAKALGAYSESVSDPADLRAAIKRAAAATESGQPALLEVITKEELRAAKG